jgi:tRNA(adenine34) deaminase
LAIPYIGIVTLHCYHNQLSFEYIHQKEVFTIASIFMDRAVAIARETVADGNIPVGAVIVLDEEIIAEGGSYVIKPVYNPGRHAEKEAIRNVPVELWPRAKEMTCYTTLEPCMMCMGALLVHGVGRIVFGATDERGGARFALAHLPPYYKDGRGVFEWIGPTDSDRCDPLYHQCDELFSKLPCGDG